MLSDAAQKIAELAKVAGNVSLGKADLRPEQNYATVDLDAKNFKKIEPLQQDSDRHLSPTHGRWMKDLVAPKLQLNVQPSGVRGLDMEHKDTEKSRKNRKTRLVAIDGGNQEIIGSPSFSVHFIRVCYNCFEGGVRTTLGVPKKIEFFSIAQSVRKEEGISFTTDLIPLNEDHRKFLPNILDLCYDSYDSSTQAGGERADIAKMGDVARSFAEWALARHVAEELDAGDIIVRDGTLHAPYTNQAKYAKALYSAAEARGVIVSAVSKTSSLYTTTGLPLSSAISRLARESNAAAPWYYENIADIRDPSHEADLNFARLNAQSKYVFRVEILKRQKDLKETVMSNLAFYSGDIAFLGYPYPLVACDQEARVTNEELEPLKMMLLSEISKQGGFEALQDGLKSLDAHDWLNKVV